MRDNRNSMCSRCDGGQRGTECCATGFTVDICPVALVPKEVYDFWLTFLMTSDGPCPVLQAPTSLAVAAAIDKNSTFSVLTIRDASGGIVGIQPIRSGPLSIPIKVGKRTWFKVFVSGVSMIGTEPLVARTDLKPAVVRAILQFMQDEAVIEYKELKRDGAIEDQITSFATRSYRMHRAGYNGPWRYAYVPPSMESYNASLGKKKLYNLRRQDRLLEEHLAGDVKLEVVRSSADLSSAILAIYQITDWPLPMLRWAAMDADLSCREGVACFFLVKCNGRLIGLIRATTWGDILHIHSIHHNIAFQKYSPGTVSWQAVVRLLILSGQIRRIVFAYGVPARGNKPVSVAEVRSHVFIYRKGVWRSSLFGILRLFNTLKMLGSKLVRVQTQSVA